MGATASELAQYKDEGPIITEKRISRMLSNIEDTNDIVVKQIITKSGSGKGDGFVSDILDVVVTALVKGKDKDYNWMVKSTPRDPNRWVLSRLRLQFDEREVKFFRDLLPRFRKFAADKNKENLVPSFCPVPYTEWSEMDKILVMQNLRTLGYRDPIDKKAGLDMDHVILAIKWLASFHALGYAFIDQYKGGIEQMQVDDLRIFFWKFSDTPNMDINLKEMKEFFGFNNENQLILMKEVDALSGNNTSYYVDVHRKMLKKIQSLHGVDSLIDAACVTRDHLQFRIKTFTHGDPWFNNVMYKYDEETKSPIDVKFIDLQTVAHASPALDLVYFIYSSTTKEIRNNLCDLLRIYHDEFITNVNQFGSLLSYTYEELNDDFYKACFWGLNFAMNALGKHLNSQEDMLDLDDLSNHIKGGNEISKETKERNASKKNNTAYLWRVKHIVDEFVSLNLL